MAEVKWIKVATDIFDNRKIKQIETMPSGDTILVIWFKLLSLSGYINDGGKIYFTSDIPYTEEMLATHFQRPIETVKLALEIFIKFNMVDTIDQGILHITSWEKYQNVDGLDKIREQTRQRVAKYKETKKDDNAPETQSNVNGNAPVTQGNVNGNVTVTHGNATDIDIDIELDIERESKDTQTFTQNQSQSLSQKHEQKRTPSHKESLSQKRTPSQRITPTLQEIQNYCCLRKNKVDAEKFFDFYTSKGWMIGKNRMEDYKACIRTWEKEAEQSRAAKTNNLAITPAYDISQIEKQLLITNST